MKRFIPLFTPILLMTSFASAEQSAPSQLNEVLAGEVSAVETYQQALEKVGTHPDSEILRKINQDHKAAVSSLENLVGKSGGQPDPDSGFWGMYAKTVMGSAKIFGDKAAIKALKEGEEHGLKEYKEVLENSNVTPEAKSYVREKAIPAQTQHINTLDQMLAKL